MTFVIRNMPADVLAAVKREAAAIGVSPRAYILDTLKGCAESDREQRESRLRIEHVQ